MATTKTTKESKIKLTLEGGVISSIRLPALSAAVKADTSGALFRTALNSIAAVYENDEQCTIVSAELVEDVASSTSYAKVTL